MSNKSGTSCWSYRLAIILPLGMLYLVMNSGDKSDEASEQEPGKTTAMQYLIGIIIVTHMFFSYLCKNGHTIIAWLIILGPIAAPAMLGATVLTALAGAGIASSV